VDIDLVFKIARVIKSRRNGWVGHVACMRDMSGAYRVFGGGPEGKKNLEYISVEGMVILKLILKKWDGEARTGLLRLRIGDRWP
jgi:hypothetical protein